MLTRITSLILTLCIGLPMCWCCISAPEREEVASCCAMKKHAASEQAPAHSQEPNCPCAKHDNKREVAATFVQAPAPDRPIDGGMATEALVAQVLIGKYCDHRVPRTHQQRWRCGAV